MIPLYRRTREIIAKAPAIYFLTAPADHSARMRRELVCSLSGRAAKSPSPLSRHSSRQTSRLHRRGVVSPYFLVMLLLLSAVHSTRHPLLCQGNKSNWSFSQSPSSATHYSCVFAIDAVELRDFESNGVFGDLAYSVLLLG